MDLRKRIRRETHEGRIEVGEGLHEIFTERAVLPVVPELGRFRKQSDEIKVEHSGGIGNDTEAAVGAAQSLQSSFIFFPFIGDASECEYIGIEVSVLILKINLEITLVGFSPEVQPEIIADVLYSRNRRSLGIVGIVIFFAFSVFCYSESILRLFRTRLRGFSPRNVRCTACNAVRHHIYHLGRSHNDA